MEAVEDRTLFGGQFENFFVLGAVVVRRKGELGDQLDNPAGIGSHHFRGFHFRAVDAEAVRFGGDAHDGEHAGAVGGGHQIGRREGFAFSLIVGGGIGQQLAAGLQMDGFGAQVAEIGGVDRSQNKNTPLF